MRRASMHKTHTDTVADPSDFRHVSKITKWIRLSAEPSGARQKWKVDLVVRGPLPGFAGIPVRGCDGVLVATACGGS